MRSPIHCLSFQGEPLQSILSQLPPEAENVLLCGDPPPQSELVGWLYNPDVLGEWSDDGTYLGQEEDRAPTIALQRGERSVRVRFASSWFDEPVTVAAAEQGFSAADRLISKQFNLSDSNFASPVALGRHLMAAAWQRDGIKVPPAPEEVRELLTTIGPQGRHELLTLPEVDTLPGLYGYDMRLAYLWCCKGLPFGEVKATAGELAHKTLVGWNAPDGWSHIGLLPTRQQGWQYPLRGGGWADHREYHLACRNAWSIDKANGLGWSSEGALDRWSDGLQWCLRQCKEDRVVYRLLRRVALNSIGALHRSAVRRSRALPVDSREAPPAGNPSLRLSADGRIYFWQEEVPLSRRQLLYCHPEWTTTIWARCRARLAQAALQWPREQVIALRQDCLFTSSRHPDWKEADRVGAFRLKEEYPGPVRAPRTLEELDRLRRGDDPDYQPDTHSLSGRVGELGADAAELQTAGK